VSGRRFWLSRFESKSRDLGNDRGYRAEVERGVVVVLSLVGLNLNPHPHEARVGHPSPEFSRRTSLFRDGGDEAIGVVAHDAGDAGFDEKAHVGGLIHGPTDDLEILFARIC
jgi:hypothetical protein